MKKRHRKLLAAYFVASLVAFWAPESLLCRVMFVLFLSHYPSTVDSEVFGFTVEEQSEIVGRLNGRARGLEFTVQGAHFLDKGGSLRFSTTLPSGMVNQLSARALRLREHDLSLRGRREPFDRTLYELAFRAGLRQELGRKVAEAAANR